MSEWKKIDPLGEFEAQREEDFLLMDEYGHIYVGSTSFDYYDAKYWAPIPRMPMDCVITDDRCIVSLLKDRKSS